MTKKPLVLLALSLCILSACADEKVEPLRSPCAGVDGSPCGPKRPVNNKSRQMVDNAVATKNIAA